jgi:hypothetical protein
MLNVVVLNVVVLSVMAPNIPSPFPFSQDPVQPVVFDWQKSGLKNPLEQNGEFVFSLG